VSFHTAFTHDDLNAIQAVFASAISQGVGENWERHKAEDDLADIMTLCDHEGAGLWSFSREMGVYVSLKPTAGRTLSAVMPDCILSAITRSQSRTRCFG